MFVDELDFTAKAGDGGDGVVRWLSLKFRPQAGPAGGDGGKGGDVYVRAVRDVALLSKYKGAKAFEADNGEAGRSKSQYGKASNDIYIDLPVGSIITNKATGIELELNQEGETIKILRGGPGGLGNVNFKSATNQAPLQATKGKLGEKGEFHVELRLTADVGLIGLPNAGKSTLLNSLTNARSAIGAYPFTTIDPHLGAFYGYTIADIPGLIEGAATGKGLGHKFLRHVRKTKMLLHLVALDSADVYQDYVTIRDELAAYDKDLLNKKEWVILTKTDLIEEGTLSEIKKLFDKNENRVFITSVVDDESIKYLSDELIKELRRA